MYEIVSNNRDVKVREISDILKISLAHIDYIFDEYLVKRKLYSKWVPRLLTISQKQLRTDDSEYCWDLFQLNKKDFFSTICSNEWNVDSSLHPESNWQSVE